MGIAPYVGLNFACYETLKLVGMRIAPEVVNNQGELPVSVRLFFGGTAGTKRSIELQQALLSLSWTGAVAQTFSFPLDVLRRRMQMQGAGEFPVYGTTWNCIKTVWYLWNPPNVADNPFRHWRGKAFAASTRVLGRICSRLLQQQPQHLLLMNTWRSCWLP